MGRRGDRADFDCVEAKEVFGDRGVRRRGVEHVDKPLVAGPKNRPIHEDGLHFVIQQLAEGRKSEGTSSGDELPPATSQLHRRLSLSLPWRCSSPTPPWEPIPGGREGAGSNATAFRRVHRCCQRRCCRSCSGSASIASIEGKLHPSEFLPGRVLMRQHKSLPEFFCKLEQHRLRRVTNGMSKSVSDELRRVGTETPVTGLSTKPR
ncbi:uncharacterized protein [Miscanthus floridulus]|uniref:uncharacterized protein n=1 Tax=Miscanthus floridulus TaxID=154761 RepID=UPI00345A0D27